MHNYYHHLSATLPKGDKYDGLDNQKLEHWLPSNQEVLGGKVEEQQGIEGKADANIVDHGYVEVATVRTVNNNDTTMKTKYHVKIISN